MLAARALAPAAKIQGRFEPRDGGDSERVGRAFPAAQAAQSHVPGDRARGTPFGQENPKRPGEGPEALYVSRTLVGAVAAGNR